MEWIAGSGADDHGAGPGQLPSQQIGGTARARPVRHRDDPRDPLGFCVAGQLLRGVVGAFGLVREQLDPSGCDPGGPQDLDRDLVGSGDFHPEPGHDVVVRARRGGEEDDPGGIAVLHKGGRLHGQAGRLTQDHHDVGLGQRTLLDYQPPDGGEEYCMLGPQHRETDQDRQGEEERPHQACNFDIAPDSPRHSDCLLLPPRG